MRTPNDQKTQEKYWKTVIGHRKAVLVKRAEAFKSHLVLSIVKKGIPELEI